MSAENEFRCPHIETCPNVLQACERKVAAETALNVAKAEYDGKRKLMNELYAAKDAEDRFDRALRACAASGKPPPPKQLKLI